MRGFWQNLKILFMVFGLVVLCIIGYFVAMVGTFVVVAIGLFMLLKVLLVDTDKPD